MIAQATEEDIRKIPIKDVIGSVIKIKPAGSVFKAQCPFHGDKTASFTVYTATETYKCFGCNQGGDGIKFIREYFGFSYVEAIEYLAEAHHITIQYDNAEKYKGEIKKYQERKTQIQLLEELANKYAASHTKESLEYLESRGFTKEMVTYLGYGFAPAGSIIAQDVFRSQPKIGRDLGYVMENDISQFDFFRNRIIVPIRNRAGKVIGFAGRSMEADPKAKWINSVNVTGLYEKSTVLYGINRAAREIRRTEIAYLVEGYFDVDAAHLAGIYNIVGYCGTAITPENITQIIDIGARLFRFIPDMDKIAEEDQGKKQKNKRAGIVSVLNGIDLVHQADCFCEVIELPQPDLAEKIDLHSYIIDNKISLSIPTVK